MDVADQYVVRPTTIPRRFEALDGLRGVAAFVVLVYHAQFGQSFQVFRHGYLAVDFFFGLSGFVIAAAYEKRMRQGLGVVPFFVRYRFVRLYPMLLLGTLLGYVSMRLGIVEPPTSVPGLVRELLLIPADHVSTGDVRPYPLDNVSWSIAYELIANLLHVALFWRMRTRDLVWVWAVSAVALAFLTVQHGTLDGGSDVQQWPLALARVMTSYTAGVVLWRRYAARGINLAASGSIFGLTGLMLSFSLWSPYGSIHAVYEDVPLVILLFPVVIALSVGSLRSRGLGKLCALLGDLSYPVYLLQLPIFWLIQPLCDRLGIEGNGFTLVSVITVLLASWASFTLYDQPVRRHVTRRFQLRPQHAGTTAP